MNESKPLDTFMINDLETLRNTADPLRMQIYEILLHEPANVRQVAERLGLAPSRLYYHVNTLEKYGLIKVVETRLVANMVEKYYRAVAYRLDIADHLLKFETDEGKQTIGEVMAGTFNTTRDDLQRSLQARAANIELGDEIKPRGVIVNRVTARMSDEQAEEFMQRLRQLIEAFEAGDHSEEDPDPVLQDFAMLLAFYPSFYYK